MPSPAALDARSECLIRDTAAVALGRKPVDAAMHALDGTRGQDIAEYAVILAAILVFVVGTIRPIGSNDNTIFSNPASSIQ